MLAECRGVTGGTGGAAHGRATTVSTQWRIRRRSAGLAAWVVAALLVAPAVQAAIDCSVSTAGINFGAYDPTSATPDDIVGNLAVTCTRVIFVDVFHVPFTVSLSRGSSTSFSPRTLRSGTNVLNYTSYRDAAHSQVWGDGTNSTVRLSDTSDFVWFQTSQTDNFALYGRIPALQDVRVGNYTDTVIVQITF